MGGGEAGKRNGREKQKKEKKDIRYLVERKKRKKLVKTVGGEKGGFNRKKAKSAMLRKPRLLSLSIRRHTGTPIKPATWGGARTDVGNQHK